MEGNLPGYAVNEATWFYLSLLLITAVYFRFGRIWSLRNLDLILLLSLSPGQLMVQQNPPVGYVWLFVGTGLLLVRLFCDGLFERRPRLEQNLNVPGLSFLGLSAFAFLMSVVLTEPPPASTVETVRRADRLLNRQDTSTSSSQQNPQPQAGPASSILAAPVVPLASAAAAGNGSKRHQRAGAEFIAARTLVILAHLAVIVGLYLVGRWHFGEGPIGLAMATLYVLLPCTSYDVGKVNHVLPAALVLWAFVAYRRPVVAGSLMGLACGTLFFPIFLLPMWAAFYDRRGALRFGSAVGVVGAVLLGSFALTSANTPSFVRQTFGSIDWSVLPMFTGEPTTGFWSMYDPAYRITVFVGFFVVLVVLTIWPRQKSLEHLMAHSTAIVVGIQLWYPDQGGQYLLWYLPLLLMVVFRPRLTNSLPPHLAAAANGAMRAPESPRPLSSRRRTTFGTRTLP